MTAAYRPFGDAAVASAGLRIARVKQAIRNPQAVCTQSRFGSLRVADYDLPGLCVGDNIQAWEVFVLLKKKERKVPVGNRPKISCSHNL